MAAGTQLFLKSTTLFGFSGSELFRASERDRLAVARAVEDGLRANVVLPVVQAVR